MLFYKPADVLSVFGLVCRVVGHDAFGDGLKAFRCLPDGGPRCLDSEQVCDIHVMVAVKGRHVRFHVANTIV